MYHYNFPEIFPGYDQDDKFLAEKVKQEVREFEEETDLAKKAMEAVDILHAAETLVRKFFDRRAFCNTDSQVWLSEVIAQVVKKNATRGYYKGEKIL